MFIALSESRSPHASIRPARPLVITLELKIVMSTQLLTSVPLIPLAQTLIQVRAMQLIIGTLSSSSDSLGSIYKWFFYSPSSFPISNYNIYLVVSVTDFLSHFQLQIWASLVYLRKWVFFELPATLSVAVTIILSTA